MATLAVILFGGGDGGGLRITDHGVERIPPYDPQVLRQLKAVNALLQAQSLESSLGREVGGATERLAQQVVAHVDKAVGGLGNGAVVYLDVDDGFSCGNGRKPVPFPHHLLASIFADRQLQAGQQLAAAVQG